MTIVKFNSDFVAIYLFSVILHLPIFLDITASMVFGLQHLFDNLSVILLFSVLTLLLFR